MALAVPVSSQEIPFPHLILNISVKMPRLLLFRLKLLAWGMFALVRILRLSITIDVTSGGDA